MTGPSSYQLGGPPEQVGHYRVIEPLGEGGMAKVFLALDTRLNRQVVLKWIKENNPESVERLKREAHLQGRLDHPAVCRVYAISEHEGWPYLVIQYIHGKTLDRAASELNLDTKLRVMITLADAVHTAHRKSLIHRDLKPSNLMIEADEAGGWRPYVMDFGLARTLGPESLSEEGTLLGSPAYMAPEQISGGTVDARTDVYGLGASLFELLSGHPPFEGATLSEILLKVRDQEAPRLRRLAPELSKDLETILQTCLAKDPDRRYPSAAALRDDLQRIQDGDSILARRTSPMEQGRRWIRRNRLASALGAVTMLLLLITGGVWLRFRLRAKAQTYWAQRFGQEVIRMEDELRFGRMLPPHDLSPEFEQVRQHMNAIRDQMARDRDARGPGHFALGTGYLLLDDYESAQNELEAAWKDDYRSPELSLALSSCLMHLYNEANQEALNIPEAEARSARQAELLKKFLQPAKRYLKQAKQELGGVPQTEESLLALVEDRYQEASTLAMSAYQASPWRYDALLEVANSISRRGQIEINAGEMDKAKQDMESALDTLDLIQTIGPSDDRIYFIRSTILNLGRQLGLRGLNSRRSLEEALTTVERSHELHQEVVGYSISEGHILVRLGDEARLHHEDSLPFYERAESAFLEAVETTRRAPSDDTYARRQRAAAFGLLVHLYGIRAYREQGTGKDIRPLVEKGLQYFQIAEVDGQLDMAAYQGLGVLQLALSKQQLARGEDASEALQQAAGGFRKYNDLQPDAVNVGNIISILLNLANVKIDQGLDPGPWLKEADDAFHEAMGLAPGLSNNHCLAGNIALLEARWMRKQGQDPLPALEKARTAYEQGRKADEENNAWRPVDNIYWPGLARVHAMMAEERLARREDPVPDALKALDYGQKAGTVKADEPEKLRQAMAQARTILQRYGKASR